jgi:hypothetical protein
MFQKMVAASACMNLVDIPKATYSEMKRIATILLCLSCLSAVAYGQQAVEWVQLRDGSVVPVVRAEPRQKVSPRTPPDWRMRASQDLRFRESLQGRDYAGQLGYALGDYFRETMEQRRERQREDAMRRQQEMPNYDAALRREWEANYRAAYAERINPSSWEARSLRQAANQASMERARAQAAVQLRDQNDMRSIYGNRVTTVPTREQWIRPGPVNNRVIPAPRQNRQVSDSERGANENRDRALDQMRDKGRQIERAVQSGRPTADLVREQKQAMDRYVEGVREASRAKREAAERNGSNDRTPRDSQPSRDSRDSAKESWQDQQRERADRRP